MLAAAHSCPSRRARPRGPALGLACALALAAGGCRERAPEPESAAADPRAPRRFSLDEDLRFAYADLAARFRHTRGAGSVPAASRQVVRVIEPTAIPGPNGDDEPVHVADLSQIEPGREIVTRVMTRAEFERRAIAALPPGLASRVQIPGGEAAPPSYPGDNGIVLYTTRWCGACQELRRFLAARQIAFVERDVERDAAAAHEAAARAAAMGVAADRVPLVDVRGTLLVGFDPDRLTTLLGDPI